MRKLWLGDQGGGKFGGLGCKRGSDGACRELLDVWWSLSLSLRSPLSVKHCRNSAQIDLTDEERVCVCAEVGGVDTGKEGKGS